MCSARLAMVNLQRRNGIVAAAAYLENAHQLTLLVAGEDEVRTVFNNVVKELQGTTNWAGHNEGFAKNNPFAVLGVSDIVG